MANAEESSPKMMVLGLVLEEPDTPAGVTRRLRERFPAARFPPSSAHTNLPALADQGYLKVLETGHSRSRVRYEGTSEGGVYFRRWMRGALPPPVVHDAIQGKLEFVELAEVIDFRREYLSTRRNATALLHLRMLASSITIRRVSGRKNVASAYIGAWDSNRSGSTTKWCVFSRMLLDSRNSTKN